MLRERTVASRFEALRAASQTPLVGREEEMELLLRRWQQIKNGEGRVVLLAGEPGIGKSRLTAALEEQSQGRSAYVPALFLPAASSRQRAAADRGAACQHAADFAPNDTPAEKRAKLEALLLGDRSGASDVELFAELLGLAERPDGRRRHGPAANRRRRLLGALIEQLETLATRADRC